VDKALTELIKISNITGSDSTLVQGGGGNTSVKTADDKYMYIKASGTALKDMNQHQGWRRMRLESVLAIMKDKTIARLEAQRREVEVVNRLLLACDDEVSSEARPSVEAHLHALLDKCVIHLHPIVVGAYVNAKNGRAELQRLFRDSKNQKSANKDNLPPLWVPYADPGFMLATKIARLVQRYQKRFGKKPAILFLQKHGLIVSAGSAEAALRLVRKVIKLCRSRLPSLKAGKRKSPAYPDIIAAKLAIRKALFKSSGQYLPISYFPATRTIAAFMARQDAAKLLATTALNPDELVYANGSAMWLEKCDAETIARRLSSLIEKGQKAPSAFLVKKLGLFVAADKKMAPIIAEITNGSLLIRMQAARWGGILSLTRREQDFINQWESEAFRKKLVSTAGQGELKNRIAVVSGAGSGLGRSIAVGLAKAGAMVGLVDIDRKQAEETAAQIRTSVGERAMILPGDVTKQVDVQAGFKALLRDWGGLDILVNAAGIAPAYPLIDMPVDKWRACLQVNLTGYFLMTKEAARIMIQQAMGGCIVNISSKSGLEASKETSAYHATKAGEIHMARGWALELGEYGIRVNCVAPGDVFEGSKIWNPQYIQVCARKYGIRPQEVIRFYVNKTALKREIRGQDVADAVVFLCSDRARAITGQVLVVDGGQVMVR